MINKTFLELDSSKTVYAVVYSSILVFGLPLNAVSLWILIRSHSLKSPSAVFMINLAFSDLLLVIFLPLKIQYYATGSSILGIAACTFISMLFRQSLRSSLILITFISLDRLLAVVYPVRSRHLRTTSNAWKACCFVWLFVLVISIAEGIEFSRDMDKCNSTCFEFPADYKMGQFNQVMAVFISVLALAMLTVNVVSIAMVSWTLLRHLYTSAQINNKINIVLIFVVNLPIIIICFVPPSLVFLFYTSNEHAIRSTLCLASVNCCLDPLVYYFSLDAFWKKKEDVEASPAREH